MLAIVSCCVALAACTAGKAKAHGGVPQHVDRALHHASRVFNVSYWDMRTVTFCESRWNPRAVGNGSYGLAQFLPSTWAHVTSSWGYGHRWILSGWWSAMAMGWLVRQDGGFREWTCRP